jgi:hypothetical protein
VDRDVTIEDARDHAFVRHHAALIHTTASHTPAWHRFRIILLLEEPIVVARDWADAQLGLALTLGGDQAATDAARLFFGNRSATFVPIGKTVSPAAAADLIAIGWGARESRKINAAKRMTLDSARPISGTDLVKLADGTTCRFDELGPRVTLHCPHHDDTDPSAFTVQSKNGGIGIHCSACMFTFWADNQRDAYDFGAFDRMFEKRRNAEQQVDEDAPGIEQYFPSRPKFFRYQQSFLPTFTYEPGLTLVKSRKGSGKTEALVSLIGDIRAGRYPSHVAREDKPKSILLIGHRRTLLREASFKLGLRCYIDADDEVVSGPTTLAVCLDSLPKHCESSAGWQFPSGRRGPFDLVIIDEVEQVLKHLLSETIEKRAGIERCFNALMHTLVHAKAVIALDADLGLLTTHAIRVIRPQWWKSHCRIIYNAPVASGEKRHMRLFQDRKRLEQEVIEAVRQGQRCFIASNSKECVNNLARMIENTCGPDLVMRVVTGDNSRDEAIVKFVKNIKVEFLNVQVVLDITFPSGECRVDRVFGFFYPMVNAHTDIDQQLCRVRNPGAVDVWISGTRFNYSCNVEVVKDDLARAYVVKRR